MKIILHGDVPSKKNSKNIAVVKNRIRIFPSSNYQKWERQQIKYLKLVLHEALLENDYQLTVKFYPSTKRKFDLSNKVESVQDLLVKAGVIADDNYSILSSVFMSYGGVDKQNPRAEVELL